MATELWARFPEIPAELRGEPTLGEFAATFSDLLAVAHKPGNCSTGYDPGNHFYVKLIGPITYFGYGLATRERVVQDLRGFLDAHAADPEGCPVASRDEDTTRDDDACDSWHGSMPNRPPHPASSN